MKITLENFKQSSEIEPAVAVTALLYGTAGVGKTEFAASAPRPLIIDIGRSKETILMPGWRERHPGIDPIIVSIEEKLGKKGAPDAAEAYDAVCDTIDYALKEFPDRFDSVVVDEASAMTLAARARAIYFNAETGKSTTKSMLDKNDIMMPAVQDFGAEMSLMEQFVRGYSDICSRAGKHFVLVAHEAVKYGKPPAIGAEPPILGVQPFFTGKKGPDNIMAMFDWVFRFTTLPASGGKTSYRIYTSGDDSYPAKCRHGGVFKQIEPATSMSDFIRRIKFHANNKPSN